MQFDGNPFKNAQPVDSELPTSRQQKELSHAVLAADDDTFH